MNIRRLDILEVDLQGALGSEQTNKRPCVVVSNELCNKHSPTIIIMPLTTKDSKRNIPTHTLVKKTDAVGLRYDSTFLGEQPRTIDRKRIIRKVGRITNLDAANKVDKACYDAFFYQS